MSNPGFPVPSLSGSNVLLTTAYYFGFPALVAVALGIVLWMIVQNIQPRIAQIETILVDRNITVFAELIDDNKKIILNQEGIHQKEEDILRAIEMHEHGNEQYWSENRENNHEALRRLDDIFHQCYQHRIDPTPDKRRSHGLDPNNGPGDERLGDGQLPRLTPQQRPGAISALPQRHIIGLMHAKSARTRRAWSAGSLWDRRPRFVSAHR